MKRILLTLCACMFVCAPDCRADGTLDQCILDNATQSELDTYNGITGSDMNSVMQKSIIYRALWNKYCSTDGSAASAAASAVASAAKSVASDTDDATANATSNSASSAAATLKSVCVSDMRHGKNPQTDECVECPVGKFFNANDSANGYCSTAIALSKSDLKYGYKSRTEKSRVSSQCWTKKNPSEYRACVKYGMPVYVGDIQTNVANVLSDPATK